MRLGRQDCLVLTFAPMIRRYFAVLLLLLVPLQLGWSVAGAYLNHQAAGEMLADHSGHHSHPQQMDGASSQPDPVTQDSSIAACDACHAVCCFMLPDVMQVPAIVVASSGNIGDRVHFRLPFLARPERPQWSPRA